jgi:hypothetical protein
MTAAEYDAMTARLAESRADMEAENRADRWAPQWESDERMDALGDRYERAFWGRG